MKLFFLPDFSCTCICDVACSTCAQRWGGDGFDILGQNRVIAIKTIKVVPNAVLELPDKVRAIKVLVSLKWLGSRTI